MVLFKKIPLLFILLGLSCSCRPNRSLSTEGYVKRNGFNNPKQQQGLLKTAYGNMIISFYVKDAPHTISRIKVLIQEGFYDGLDFYRVVPGAVIQTGIPNSSKAISNRVKIQDELSSRAHKKGILAMVKDSERPDSADTRFYIALKDIPELDNKYTIFGKVVKGIDILNKIKKGDIILSFSLISI